MIHTYVNLRFRRHLLYISHVFGLKYLFFMLLIYFYFFFMLREHKGRKDGRKEMKTEANGNRSTKIEPRQVISKIRKTPGRFGTPRPDAR